MSEPTVIECSWPVETELAAQARRFSETFAKLASAQLSAAQSFRAASAMMKFATTNTTNFKL